MSILARNLRSEERLVVRVHVLVHVRLASIDTTRSPTRPLTGMFSCKAVVEGSEGVHGGREGEGCGGGLREGGGSDGCCGEGGGSEGGGGEGAARAAATARAAS